jgi:hypothetical protein
MKKSFDNAGDFQACYAAEKWCEERLIAVGPAQGLEPRGLLFGFYAIAKWRNLSAVERRQLDGRMTGDMRHGPVTIDLNGLEVDYPIVGQAG